MDTADLFDPGVGVDARSGSELTALLVELARVVKGRRFYAPGRAELSALFERGLRTWRGDLERHGPLEFDVGASGFRSAGSHEVLGHPQLASLLRVFRTRGIERVRVEDAIDAEAFAGLVEMLALDDAQLDAEGGALRALYARVPFGIVLNAVPADAADALAAQPEEAWSTGPTEPLDGEHADATAPEHAEDAAWAAPGTSEAADEDLIAAADFFDDEADDADEVDTSPFGVLGEDDSLDEITDPVADVPPQPTADVPPQPTADLPPQPTVDVPPQSSVEEPAAWAAPESFDPDEGELRFVDEELAPAAAPPEEDLDARGDLFGSSGGMHGAPEAESAIELAEEPRFADADGEPVFDLDVPPDTGDEPDEIELTDLPEEAPSGSRPSFDDLEAGPLDRGVVDVKSAQLVDLLRELQDCEEVSQYVELARRAVQLGERAAETGRLDDAYRVMLVLSLHAAQHGKRPERQCAMAQDFLVGLAQGPRLEHLIDRACAPGPESSVRATQILLQLGEEVVPALLGAAVLEKDPDRRGQMHGVLIAMGEKTLPELLRSMDADDPELVRTAVRLVGETQNPGALPRLAQLLKTPDREVREEAAKSLVRIGTPRAVDLLVESIDDPRVGDVAIYCLGACGSARPVEPLVTALQGAIEAGRLERAREIIRALGRLGRSEAVPALAELLLRKSVFGRRKLREVQLAAAAALAGLPGDEAVGALAQAARSRDAQLRRVAQTALDRRARSLARGASA